MLWLPALCFVCTQDFTFYLISNNLIFSNTLDNPLYWGFNRESFMPKQAVEGLQLCFWNQGPPEIAPFSSQRCRMSALPKFLHTKPGKPFHYLLGAIVMLKQGRAFAKDGSPLLYLGSRPQLWKKPAPGFSNDTTGRNSSRPHICANVFLAFALNSLLTFPSSPPYPLLPNPAKPRWSQRGLC